MDRIKIPCDQCNRKGMIVVHEKRHTEFCDKCNGNGFRYLLGSFGDNGAWLEHLCLATGEMRKVLASNQKLGDDFNAKVQGYQAVLDAIFEDATRAVIHKKLARLQSEKISV